MIDRSWIGTQFAPLRVEVEPEDFVSSPKRSERHGRSTSTWRRLGIWAGLPFQYLRRFCSASRWNNPTPGTSWA